SFAPAPAPASPRAGPPSAGPPPAAGPAPSAEAVKLAERIADLEKRRTALDDAVRRRIQGDRPQETGPPTPYARWSFAADAGGGGGRLPGTLHGGAVVRDGRLVLDGKAAFLSTPPLGRDVTAQTFA